MKKEEVQKRVLKNGKPLDLDKFMWDKNSNTFSSRENNLFLDFEGVNLCFINTGNDCTLNTGFGCTIKTGYNCNINTSHDCTIETCSDSIINTRYDCTIITGCRCIINTGGFCTITTCSESTIKTGNDCVIIRKHEEKLEIIKSKKEIKLQIAPYGVKGYIKDGIYSKTGKPAIICDNVLSEYTSKKVVNGLEIYKIKDGYIVKDGELSAHGKSIKKCKEDLKFKISNRDTSKYKNYTLDTIVSQEEAIKMYRIITGACEFGTKKFCESIKLKKNYSIQEIIDITKNQYENESFKSFFINKGVKND